MKVPSKLWQDPANAEEPLEELVKYFLEYHRAKSNASSWQTIDKYRKSLLSFTRSLQAHGVPLVLGSVTTHAVNLWINEQRERGLSEDGIASRLSAVKCFTNTYLFHYCQLTTGDLLERVNRITLTAKPFPRLSDEEQERLLDAFDTPDFDDRRNAAMMACFLSTGRRLSEVLEMTMANLNTVSGEFTVRTKGGDINQSCLSPNALRFVKRYLRDRPQSASDRVWLTATGTPLTFWGAQSIFRRLKEKTGMKKLHAHLLRHHFAQVCLEKGAERALVQDLLGHKSDQMTRRYTVTVRQQTAAKMSPKYSPL